MSIVQTISLRSYAVLARVYWGRVSAVLAIVCLLSVLYQLRLPDNITTSRARAGNIDLVSMTPDQIESTFESIEESSYLYLRVRDEQYIKKYTDLGIQVDTAKLRQLADYKITDKLVPFSAVSRYAKSEAQEISYTFDREKARAVLEEITAFEYQEPVSAELATEGSQFSVVPHTLGSEIDIEASLELLADIKYQDRIELELATSEIYPQIDSAHVEPLAEEANRYVSNAPVIVADEQTFTVAPGDLATWFYMETEKGDPSLEIYEEKVDAYLDQVANALRLPATNTVVTLRDGQEISRIPGKAGRFIDKDAVLADFKTSLKDGQLNKQVAVSYKQLSPRVTYRYTYSETNAGLANLLRDIGSRSGDYKISVIGLDKNVRASYRGNIVTVAASTYKVYVAYYLFLQIENGSVSWSDKLPSGRQIDYCLDQMIVISSNTCAHELRDLFGAGTINTKLREIGLPNAGFGSAYAQTSSDELNRFLELLVKGQLVNKTHTNTLISMMRRQIHRLAIPTGVAPAPVADKGGFVWGYNNDTGIVYGKNGTYIITILARNESKSDLARVAAEVHTYMESL